MEQILQQVELILSGSTMKAEINGQSTDVKYAAPILNPIEDLKNLGVKVDKCGRVVDMSDATAGGVLPNGDAARVLGAASPCYGQ